ncbi:MAG TPA: hypothetical protein VGL88_05005 [Pseudonocardiaceae bacterium]
MTVFALAYALLSPVLATLTGNWTRRQVLLTALGVFVLGNVLAAGLVMSELAHQHAQGRMSARR